MHKQKKSEIKNLRGKINTLPQGYRCTLYAKNLDTQKTFFFLVNIYRIHKQKKSEIKNLRCKINNSIFLYNKVYIYYILFYRPYKFIK